MDKERLFIVTALCFLLATEGLCQKFNYNSQKKQNSEYNVELSNALRSNDPQAMGRILSKNPSLVDAASTEYDASKQLRLKATVPLICDAVQRCLDQQCSVQMVETILGFHPNLNCKSKGLPPFYMVLNYIAHHKISECGRAEELFFVFLNKSNIDIKERPVDLPPSFSYLLTENYNFLNGHFSKEYISPEIIKAFVDKGASINTNDVNSNSILSFATLTQNQELIDYCLGSGANLTSTNKEGKDAFYYAVANKDYDATRSILESGYPLSESRLASLQMKPTIAQAGSNIQELLFERLKLGKKNLTELKTLYEFFPNQRGRYLSEGFNRANLDLTQNQLPEFIDMFAAVQLDRTGASNLESLKKEYILGSNNLSSFGAALKKYPIVSFNYSDKYYESESTYKTLLADLQNLKSSFPSDLIEQFSREAKDRQQSFINSDWRGNPSVGKKVVDGYPYMYDKVVSELYRDIAAMSISRYDYSNDHTSKWMREELSTLNQQIRYCDNFISGFGNSSYGAQAKEKRNALSNRSYYVESSMRSWEYRISNARSKFYDYKKSILEKGPTPSYEMGNWEYYEEVELFGPNTKCHRAKCEVKINYHTYTFYASHCENDDGYDIQESGWFDYSTLIWDCSSVGEGIRKAIWSKLAYDSNASDDRIIDFVTFLDTHKNSDWWSFKDR